MSTIAGSPVTLRGNSAALLGHARSMQSASARIRDAGTSCTTVWRGAASVQYLARSALVSSAMTQAAEQVEGVARASLGYAGRLEQAQQQADALERQQCTLREELDALVRRALGPLENPLAPQIERRMEQLRVEIAVLDRRIEGVREDLLGWQRVYAEVLRGLLPVIPPWLLTLKEVARGAGQTWKGVRGLVLAVALVGHLGALGSVLDPAERLARARGAAEILRSLRKPPAWTRVVGRGPWSRIGPLGLAWRTGSDVLTGGGYTGWRGALTRYYAAEATLGAVAIGARHPLAVAVGAGLVGKWALWRGGNALWDNRHGITRFTARIWRGVRAGASRGPVKAVRLLVSPVERAGAGARWLRRQTERTRPYAPGRPLLPDRSEPPPRLRLPTPPGLPCWRVPPAAPPTLPVEPPSLRSEPFESQHRLPGHRLPGHRLLR